MITMARLLFSDYLAHYEHRQESRTTLALLCIPRFIANGSLHANFLIRICLCGPRPLFFVWRNLLIAKHSIDLGPGCQIGPGLNLPHPFGIVLATEVTIGRNVLLYHNVTLGTKRAPKPGERLGVPTVDDDVIIHPNSVIAGRVNIGAGSVIGANSFVDHDVLPGATYRRRR